jgi:hypothetical protein
MLPRIVSAVLALSALLVPGLSALGAEKPANERPWVPERVEERLAVTDDFNTLILPSISPGHRPLCENPPDGTAILRALRPVLKGVPAIWEVFRDDVTYSVEKLVDRIDPVRFYPLVGPAQLHHCHYKCTVCYTAIIESAFPFPFACKQRRSEVVYIDRDHLHLATCTPETLKSITKANSSLPPEPAPSARGMAHGEEVR